MSQQTMSQEDLAGLLEEHTGQLLLIIRFRMDRRMNGRLAAEDVLQEVYMAAHARLAHYDASKHTPFLWLRMMTVQTLYDLYRKHLGAQARDARKEQGGTFDVGATSASIIFQLSGGGTSPSVKVIRQENADQLHALLASLSPLDQEILALRHFEELNNSEVAAVLDIETKAASIRYVRALRRLKALVVDDAA